MRTIKAHYRCEFCQTEFIAEMQIDCRILEWMAQCPLRAPHPCSTTRTGVAHLIGVSED